MDPPINSSRTIENYKNTEQTRLPLSAITLPFFASLSATLRLWHSCSFPRPSNINFFFSFHSIPYLARLSADYPSHCYLRRTVIADYRDGNVISPPPHSLSTLTNGITVRWRRFTQPYIISIWKTQSPTDTHTVEYTTENMHSRSVFQYCEGPNLSEWSRQRQKYWVRTRHSVAPTTPRSLPQEMSQQATNSAGRLPAPQPGTFAGPTAFVNQLQKSLL